MPERPVTIAYAAGAGLAAIALVYVFQPTFFIDGDSAGTSASSRKRGIVGLSNSANDCFINSVLQALAGLGDLRIYLIRETHRRKLDDAQIYAHVVDDPVRKGLPAWKLEGLQAGTVTHGLKEILDSLNERPIYRKTISATGFVTVLEQAFRQRISRQQQDAQEFLQIVAERLCDEYHAGQRARERANQLALNGENPTLDRDNTPPDGSSSQPTIEVDNGFLNGGRILDTESISNGAGDGTESPHPNGLLDNSEEGFPLEGGSEQQIECLTCKFKPKPTGTTFCTLSLSVPQVSSTTLNSCFDGMFKTEYIEDFKCEKCRLIHALTMFKEEYAKSNSEKYKTKIENAISQLEDAIETNPEKELNDVELPNIKFAPKRKIAKHVRITKFPKILAIHLSRSIFDINSTMKNSAKVSFPERLRLGGLLDRKMYRLISVVCHKGSHHSGHYESFRRQYMSPPFSTPNTFHVAGVYSKPPTPNASLLSTPQITALRKPDDYSGDISPAISTPELLSSSPDSVSGTSIPPLNGVGSPSSSTININGRPISNSPPTSSGKSSKANGPTSSPNNDAETSSIRSLARSAKSTLSKVHRSSSTSTRDRSESNTNNAKETAPKPSVADVLRGGSKAKRASSRWWRISDEKVKESKTSDVLGMQREVYMLFYELEKDDDGRS
ncbi:Cysteine proteinase [Venustampulla echinocandica]|uniref:Ubiquitin carboxyl-terminal hydrolase n=1 Tax=Venustampulla echinocandica TaxID=2656787 RepID=A0A370U380_9HELO|nr:Cysteine proteinase [Venustampulla echinocandica]RDL42222.1 Cysteine proteinase [Venustampulla echinocandica]